MRQLREDERKFLWEILEKGEKDSNNGYVRFKYNGKTYKRSRILYQIYHNLFIYPDEVIHHKNEEKSDDSITNLELKDFSKHNSEHHAGSKKDYKLKERQYNKIDEEKVKEIFKLAKIYKLNGKPNCLKISKRLGISDQCVLNYLKKGKGSSKII